MTEQQNLMQTQCGNRKNSYRPSFCTRRASSIELMTCARNNIGRLEIFFMIIQVAETRKIRRFMETSMEAFVRLVVYCRLRFAASGKLKLKAETNGVLTNIIGICEISWPLSSLITAQIGRSSSRLCREHTEYTKMKA